MLIYVPDKTDAQIPRQEDCLVINLGKCVSVCRSVWKMLKIELKFNKTKRNIHLYHPPEIT